MLPGKYNKLAGNQIGFLLVLFFFFFPLKVAGDNILSSPGKSPAPTS